MHESAGGRNSDLQASLPLASISTPDSAGETPSLSVPDHAIRAFRPQSVSGIKF